MSGIYEIAQTRMAWTVSVYAIGIIIYLIFFTQVGKKVGLDFSKERRLNLFTYGDKSINNVQADFVFALGWPLMIPVLIILGIYNLVKKLTKKRKKRKQLISGNPTTLNYNEKL